VTAPVVTPDQDTTAPRRHLGATPVIAVAMAMCAPSIWGALNDAVTIDTLLLRLLLALAVSWAAVRAVDRVITGYAGGHHRAHPDR
jgi:hypothetical protein